MVSSAAACQFCLVTDRSNRSCVKDGIYFLYGSNDEGHGAVLSVCTCMHNGGLAFWSRHTPPVHTSFTVLWGYPAREHSMVLPSEVVHQNWIFVSVVSN